MNKKRTSPIWKMPVEDFEKLVKESSSISAILRHFNFAVTGSTQASVKKRIIFEDIDASHIPLGHASNRGKHFFLSKIPLEEILVRDSQYSRSSLKKRLIAGGLLKEKCSICKQPPTWKGEPLILVLDHINGTRDDNRIENLRLLCPNCNSQQPTFAGRRNKIHRYCKCGTEINKKSQHCRKCCPKIQLRRVKRPSKKVLLLDIEQLGHCGTGRKYGVSDNAIRKWLKFHS